jgi:hypothetical protein
MNSTTSTVTQAPYAVLSLRGQSPDAAEFSRNQNDGPLEYTGSLDKFEVSNQANGDSACDIAYPPCGQTALRRHSSDRPRIQQGITIGRSAQCREF